MHCEREESASLQHGGHGSILQEAEARGNSGLGGRDPLWGPVGWTVLLSLLSCARAVSVDVEMPLCGRGRSTGQMRKWQY